MSETNRPSSSKRVANELVALSSAAILVVYSAGYLRTRAAAERLAGAAGPRSVVPAPAAVTAPIVQLPPASDTAGPATTPPPRNPAKARPKSPPKSAVVAPAPASDPLPVASAPASAPASAAAEAKPTETKPVESKPVEPEQKPAPPSPYKDGTYYGWGTSRHGDIQAGVVIEHGRITSAFIAQCLTRYSCSWIAALPPQVVSRQSAEVDFVSGATQSTNAFYYAVLEALGKAK